MIGFMMMIAESTSKGVDFCFGAISEKRVYDLGLEKYYFIRIPLSYYRIELEQDLY